jgi:hypothetical protein
VKFSEYLKIREDERFATISSLLAEIAVLESKLMELSMAYKEVTGNHHQAGFIIKEEK